MKHIQLIELLYKHRKLIDKAYLNRSIENIDPALEESNLFIKIGRYYNLNQRYIDFANTILERLDYNIIFGDYEAEHKQLIEIKTKFFNNKTQENKKQIINLIKSLYSKFNNRDKEIGILLQKLESDTASELDALIDQANNIVTKVKELVSGNGKIKTLFSEDLKGLDAEIDQLLKDIETNFLGFIDNIETTIERLIVFIGQSKKRRNQNKHINNIANQILNEEADKLDEYLSSSYNKLYYTINQNKQSKITTWAVDEDFNGRNAVLRDVVDDVAIDKPITNSQLRKPKVKKVIFVNIDKIIVDLARDKPNDIFIYIKQHQQLRNKDGSILKDKAFEVFLYIINKNTQNIGKSHQVNKFNKDNIRIMQWI